MFRKIYQNMDLKKLVIKLVYLGAEVNRLRVDSNYE
jgi:hypothetical protein